MALNMRRSDAKVRFHLEEVKQKEYDLVLWNCQHFSASPHHTFCRFVGARVPRRTLGPCPSRYMFEKAAEASKG